LFDSHLSSKKKSAPPTKVRGGRINKIIYRLFYWFNVLD